jgi:hypothetical protein
MIVAKIQEFSVGSLVYELILPPQGSISLRLVGGYSPKIGGIRAALEEYDPFQKWEDYDPNEFGVLGDEDVGVNVFALKRECVKRIIGWAKKSRPSYFTFSSSTERKIRLYERVSREIVRKLPEYSFQKVGCAHHFYRHASQV